MTCQQHGVRPPLAVLFLVLTIVAVTVRSGNGVDAAAAAGRPAIAIDIGNEWLKVCLVNPNAPTSTTVFELAVNELSNRKTPAIVGFSAAPANSRLVGEAAYSLLFRNPGRAFPNLKRLIGHRNSDSAAVAYQKDWAGHFTIGADPSRGSIVFKNAVAGKDVGVEELYAMILQYARRLAEHHTLTQDRPTVLDEAVITVPESFSSSQRELVTQLADLAGIKVLALIHELTGVAIDYSLRNVDIDSTKKVIFYGMGSHGVTAALVQVSKTAGANGAKDTIDVKVLATSSDDTVGGLQFDLRLSQFLAAEFDKQRRVKNKQATSITTSKKALARLLRETREIKEQLSVGPNNFVHIEELFEETDFKFTLSREQFEQTSQDLFKKLTVPIDQVLSAAGVTPADVAAIELYGGGIRIPKVQAILHERFPTILIGKHIDGDEAAVFGAAYYAASLNQVSLVGRVTIEEKVGDNRRQQKTAAQDSRTASRKHRDREKGMSPASSAVSLPALSEADRLALRGRLSEWDAIEQRRQLAEEARNRLESFVVASRENLETSGNKKIGAAERDRITDLLDGAMAFLDETSSDATLEASEFDSKLSDLKLAVAPKKTDQGATKAKPPTKAEAGTKGGKAGAKKPTKDEL